jgi:hypothetical protein
MANYMIAHLQLGSYRRSDGTPIRILQESTMSELHSNGFSHHPQLLGQANTFDEMSYNGLRYLRKFGGAPGMQNSLVLMPSEGMGFYLFANTDGTALRNHWTQKVVETYLRTGKTVHTTTNPIKEADAQIDTEAYEGIYTQLSDQTSQTTIVQVQALLDPDQWLQVRANDDGSLLVNSQHHVPVDSVLFKNTSSGGYTAFELEESGDAKYLFQARFPYRRVSWIMAPNVQLSILGVSLLIFLAASVFTAIQVLRRRGRSALLPGGISALNLLFVISLVIIMLPVATGGDKWQFSFEPSLALRSVLLIPLVTGMLASGLLVKTMIDWRQGKGSRITGWVSILVLVGITIFLFFLDTWNLLGWRF